MPFKWNDPNYPVDPRKAAEHSRKKGKVYPTGKYQQFWCPFCKAVTPHARLGQWYITRPKYECVYCGKEKMFEA